jgi:uncharacterized repeat protein (TIGR01451 family)
MKKNASLVMVLVAGLLVVSLTVGCSSSRSYPSRNSAYAASPPAQKSAVDPKEERASRITGETRKSEGDMNSVSLAFPTGDNASAPIMLEKISPAEVVLGAPVDFEIRATNTSNFTLHDVVINDYLPENFELIEATPKFTDLIDDKATCVLGSLEPQESKVLRIRGKATQPGTLSGCTTVSFNPRICTATRVVQPALRLVKNAPADSLRCDVIPLHYVVSNNGTGMAKGVTISDTLPQGMVTAEGRGKVALNAGDLAEGQSREFTVNVQPQKTGKFGSEAIATASNNLEASDDALTVVREPILAIRQEGPKKQYLGRPVTYAIAVNNKGDAQAKNTAIVNELPPGTTFVKASQGGKYADGKITWAVGTLSTEASKEVTYTVMPANIGSVKSIARVNSDCAAPVTASAQTNVAGIPAILLEVVDVEDPIEVGGNVTYVIKVTNQGSAPGTNIKVSCELEDTFQFVSSSGATRGSVKGNKIAFASLAQLAPKAQASWKLIAKAIGEGDSRFTVNLNSDQMTRPVTETEATNLYQ